MTDRQDEVEHSLEAVVGDPSAAQHKGGLRRLTGELRGSARTAGRRAVVSGQWAATTLVDLAPRVPLRDHATLVAQHGGATGDELAEALIRHASITAAGIGAAAGALAGASELAPPAWVAIPLELVVETIAVAVVELKLVAELHEAYGRPIPGTGMARAVPLLRAWADRRGVSPSMLTSAGTITDTLGRSARDELVKLVRRRLVRKMGRNLTSLAPVLIGAAAGAEVNRRAARKLGEQVADDLRRR